MNKIIGLMILLCAYSVYSMDIASQIVLQKDTAVATGITDHPFKWVHSIRILCEECAKFRYLRTEAAAQEYNKLYTLRIRLLQAEEQHYFQQPTVEGIIAALNQEREL
jgi:hypothetical protein